MINFSGFEYDGRRSEGLGEKTTYGWSCVPQESCIQNRKKIRERRRETDTEKEKEKERRYSKDLEGKIKIHRRKQL